MLTGVHITGAVLGLLVFIVAGLRSARGISSGSDFSGESRRAGLGVVTGSLAGSLVGGASTIGTSQLAFTYGLSALWFTIGGALGCLVFALIFASPLYESGCTSLPQLLTKKYGKTAGLAALFLTSVGSFMAVVAQVLSGVALLDTFSDLPFAVSVLIMLCLMLVYVIFGGLMGTGKLGLIKTGLLAAGLFASAFLVLGEGDSFFFAWKELPPEQFRNIFARGAAVDIGSCLSLVLGVLMTQSYLQAVLGARNVKTGRQGLLISAAIFPFIGIAGVLVGIRMRIAHSGSSAAVALPGYMLECFPPILGGLMLAVLLITVVGTGAGLSLGIASTLYSDFLKPILPKEQNEQASLRWVRCIIAVLLVLAALMSLGNMGSLIQSWSFLSMGLRGAAGFIPTCAALFFPEKVTRKGVLVSIIAGPVFTLAGKFILPPQIDSLFLGIGISFAVIAIDMLIKRKHGMRCL